MTRAENRYRRLKHINRKVRILKNHRADNMPAFLDSKDVFNYRTIFENTSYFETLKYGCCDTFAYYPHKGYLNKNKIHCSCIMCSAKSKNKKKSRRGFAPIYNYKKSDKVKLDSLHDKLLDYKNSF